MAVQYTPWELLLEDMSSIATTPTTTPTATPMPTPTPSVRKKKSGPKEPPSAQAICPFPKCANRRRRKYGRLQELNRHVRQHLPNHLRCPQKGCNWTGNRRYALRNHIEKKHQGVPLAEHAAEQEHEQEGFVIYDAKTLAKQLLNEEIGVDWAVCEARSLFQIKAVQLGMLGAWRE
jgi:hypothetical protein